VAADQAVLVKRTDRSKEALPIGALTGELPRRLDAYQAELFRRALEFRQANTRRVDTYAEFKSALEEGGGFLLAPWCGDAACERRISEETGATIRVIPSDAADEPGACLIDGRPSERRALFARAY
jgi:prolyl-tRNA synthetase